LIIKKNPLLAFTTKKISNHLT